MVIGEGGKEEFLSEERLRELTVQALSKENLSGKRVLAIIPDATRTAPVPLFFRLFNEILRGRAKALDFLVALGTHPPMSEENLLRLVGISTEERASTYRDVKIFNHRWDSPEDLATIGTIPADEIEEISRGLMREDVRVEINKVVLEYDFLILLAPTFPHEVVGFSGGNKYFFPGVSGPDVLNFFHWLAAVITNVEINGKKDTPVRRVIDRACSFLKTPRLCFSLVVTHGGVKGLYIGSPEEAFSKAADLSSEVHIVYKRHPFKKVLSMAPKMYDDIWTAGKCMYKLEPVVADGGELIIYAPHITEVSYTHGKILDRIGYHTRDYFLKQMERFKDIPRAVLAHSTHVKGLGTFQGGVECPRVEVTLATGIPEERCRRINLGYKNPATIEPEEWEGREKEGLLLVRNAGETLYRLAPVPD